MESIPTRSDRRVALRVGSSSRKLQAKKDMRHAEQHTKGPNPRVHRPHPRPVHLLRADPLQARDQHQHAAHFEVGRRPDYQVLAAKENRDHPARKGHREPGAGKARQVLVAPQQLSTHTRPRPTSPEPQATPNPPQSE